MMEAYEQLRGVEIIGRAEPVGDVPRTTAPAPQLDAVESAYARKYAGIDTFVPDGRHAWLRVTPDKITSWDFRKLPWSGADGGEPPVQDGSRLLGRVRAD
jgi:hypothetical protein